MQVVLVMFRADGERRSFSLPRTVTVIGRREDCDLRIPLGDVSRKHCRFIADNDTLQPDVVGLVEAASILIKDGFEVFPYCTEDLSVAMRLVDTGCKVVMPWAAPIGSAKGIINRDALKLMRERLADVTLVVDAGLGAPSHAAHALELGYDAVLLNTAIAKAADPVAMANAFRLGVEAGRTAYEAGLMEARDFASPSTPVIGTPFWHAVS